MKYILCIIVGIGAVFMVGFSSAKAASTSTVISTLECVKNAVDDRESRVAFAFNAFKATTTLMLQVRREGLKVAWEQQYENDKIRTSNVKAVWKNFRKSYFSAKKAFNAAKKKAWNQYSMDIKNDCKIKSWIPGLDTIGQELSF